MALLDILQKQLVAIIQWPEDGLGALVRRFPVANMKIQYGALLALRKSQMAVFLNEGKVTDVYGHGMYKLATQANQVLR